MDARDGQTVLTSDGRTLMFAEWGDPGGVPVFLLHGSPGSRLGRYYDEQMYVEIGVRLITYDRPGYGGSERHPGRSTVDCVSDVERIADGLGIDRFAVRGASGGGPHALAVAARLPERVTRAACSVSPAPYEALGAAWHDGMDAENVRLTELALEGGPNYVAELERLAAGMLQRAETDPANILGDEWSLSEADQAELAKPERFDVNRQDTREAFRNGVWGLVDDDHALLTPWGFDVSEIRVPTQIIYGATDVMVPKQHGEWLAANVPNAEVVVEEELGHLGNSDLLAEYYKWSVQPT